MLPVGTRPSPDHPGIIVLVLGISPGGSQPAGFSIAWSALNRVAALLRHEILQGDLARGNQYLRVTKNSEAIEYSLLPNT